MDEHKLRHMEDLAAKAVREGCAATRFLTPAEAAAVIMRFSCAYETEISFEGGFEDAERKRAVFLNPDWGKYDRPSLLTALEIQYRLQDTLGHRDILGALMGLGIERDTIGDIAAETQSAVLVCLPELSEYIIENLTKIGRIGVNISKVTLDKLQNRTETFIEKNDTIPSLRLDAMLCAAFGLSRGKASDMITAGQVSFNYIPCMQPTKEISEGAVLSVRGMGRAKVLKIGGRSRKNRIFVRIGLYGR